MVSAIACFLMFVFAMASTIFIILSNVFDVDVMEEISLVAYSLSLLCGLIALFAIPWSIGK